MIPSHMTKDDIEKVLDALAKESQKVRSLLKKQCKEPEWQVQSLIFSLCEIYINMPESPYKEAVKAAVIAFGSKLEELE